MKIHTRPGLNDATPQAALRLTQLSHGAGCGCKLRPADLFNVLHNLPPIKDKRVLVGPSTRDDAAIFRLSKDLALVATTDFFTPVVDDPFLFGRIAAANALSDVYAMGGEPLYALSLVAFPLEKLGAAMLADIVHGATDACAEAGIAIVGGHSIDDPEPKFGLAVTGKVHPREVLSNAGARPGDALILTKPLGVGVATTAIKRGIESPAIAAAVSHMAALNKTAGEVLARAEIHALTDVTGFGLLGHLWNVVEASGVQAIVRFQDVPLLPGVMELVDAGVVPGGTRRNLADVGSHVRFPKDFLESKQLLLADAQTNGGLLAAVPLRSVSALMKTLYRKKVPAAVIGELRAGRPRIIVQ